MQLQLHYTNYTTLQLQLHYTTTTAALHHTTSSSCGNRPHDHCNHCNHSKKHNSNHLSVHQCIRSAIRHSQQPTSPIIFPIFETSATALCGTTELLVLDQYFSSYSSVKSPISGHLACKTPQPLAAAAGSGPPGRAKARRSQALPVWSFPMGYLQYPNTWRVPPSLRKLPFRIGPV